MKSLHPTKVLWPAYQLWAIGLRWNLALDTARFLNMVGAPLRGGMRTSATEGGQTPEPTAHRISPHHKRSN